MTAQYVLFLVFGVMVCLPQFSFRIQEKTLMVVIEFNNYNRRFYHPFAAYYDFECVTKKLIYKLREKG